MKEKFVKFYTSTVLNAAELSNGIRLQVGALIVKDNAIISYGFNGTPSGRDNACENKVFMPPNSGGWVSPEEIEERYPYIGVNEETKKVQRYKLVTKDEVIHAEMNAILKVSASTNSTKDSTIFITHAPCVPCAKHIHAAGIKEVYYVNDYRDMSGVDLLKELGVIVTKVNAN